MKRFMFLIAATTAIFALGARPADACTGISLTAKDGSKVVARTVEWAATPMTSGYVVVPRAYEQVSYAPEGSTGLRFKSTYGYVGVYTEYEPFVVEGVNEKGLSAGLFFFPKSGEYPEISKHERGVVSDMQLVSYILGKCANVEEVRSAIKNLKVAALDDKVGTVHWRFTDVSGRMVVLEYINGKAVWYENVLGVLTNSPSFDWHIANLSNYVNLSPGNAPVKELSPGVQLNAFGNGSLMHGLPGDYTPPSRFIRAAFLQSTSPQQKTGFAAVIQCFHILNSFDIPIGMQHPKDKAPAGMQSATQVTCATDLGDMRFYYRTAWNSNIRCIKLNDINFASVKYQSDKLDKVRSQPIENISIR